MKNKVLSDLIKNHVLFSLLIGIIIILLVVYLDKQMAKKMNGFKNLQAGEIVRENYEKMNIETIEIFGGWVEILDENLKIVYIKGQKKDTLTFYTEREFRALFYDDKKSKYHSSVIPFQGIDGNSYYCLVKIPSTSLERELVISDTNEEILSYFVRESLQALFVFIVFFLISIYMFSRRISKNITNPLGILAQGFEKIASGKYDTKVDYKANYELMQIQHAFNYMSNTLKKTEKEKQTLEESKRRMLADLSHDLKTPITTIQGYIEAMKLGMIKEKDMENILNTLHNKVRIVALLIEDIFELSKLDRSDYPLEVQSTDICEFTREIVVDYYNTFRDNGFIFKYQIPTNEIHIAINKMLLYRAISNLLSNALKYNEPGTMVIISLAHTKDMVYIEIVDNGIGIPKELKETIFDAFVRGDSSRKNDGGTGLGLTITKQIVEKHGGNICLSDENGNTHFRISLPK